jgi:ornithine cyclodeaminase
LTSLIALTAGDVRRLLPMDRCIDLMADALGGLARGEAMNPLRAGYRLPSGKGLIAAMPGALGYGPFGAKLISVFPGNREVGLESHQGLIVLFDGEHGAPTAIVDAAAVTEIRTAAVSGVATRTLAREDAHDLAILGSGTQALSHLEAILAVRPLTRIRAWSPTRTRLEAFASLASEHGKVGMAASAREAVEGADIVCTVTASADPVLLGEWLSDGAHVNAVGSSVASARELDAEAVRRSRFFVDRRESAVNESGDLLFAIREGVVDASHVVGELGEVLIGTTEGRQTADQITVFESLGLAVEDLAAAAFVVEQARIQDMGSVLEL